MLRVENNLNKMAYLMFALRYFDVSGFLQVLGGGLEPFRRVLLSGGLLFPEVKSRGTLRVQGKKQNSLFPAGPVIKVTVYLQGCLARKRCSACSLSCRYLNPYIKLKLMELAIKLYQQF